MENMSWILMVLVILLLIVIVFGIYLVMRQQSYLTKKLAQENEMARVNFETMKELNFRIEKMQTQTGLSLENSRQLTTQIQAITQVMTNAKRRGNFGEYQLESIIRTYLGDSPHIYETQYHLKNGKISDGAFHLPGSDQVLCIDSKFPMENYTKMVEEPGHADQYERELRRNIKKHIVDVASKYINEETIDVAILFIPNEGVFSWLCSKGSDLMDFAIQQHVMLVSPTTLAGVVFTLLASTRNFYRAKNLEQIEKQLEVLELQADAICEQAEKTGRTLTSLEKQNEELSKLAKRLRMTIGRLAFPDASEEENDYDFGFIVQKDQKSE